MSTDMDGLAGNPPNDFYDFHDRCIIAHAVFAGIVVFGCLPTALLAARYRQNASPRMRTIHVVSNYISLGLVTIIFALGVAGVMWEGEGNQFDAAWTDTHHSSGLAAFLIVWTQIGVGLAWGRMPGLTMRIIHMVLGIGTAATLYLAYFSGLDEWGSMSDVQTQTPAAVYYVSWVLFLVLAAAYVFGFSRRTPKWVDWEMSAPLLEKAGGVGAPQAQCGC